jgi:hypothetical protein
MRRAEIVAQLVLVAVVLTVAVVLFSPAPDVLPPRARCEVVCGSFKVSAVRLDRDGKLLDCACSGDPR